MTGRRGNTLSFGEFYDLWQRILRNGKRCSQMTTSAGTTSVSPAGLWSNVHHLHLTLMRESCRNIDDKKKVLIASNVPVSIKYIRKLYYPKNRIKS